MRPIVTIGVCARNCESSIDNVAKSIKCQSFPHELMEVVFVDDGSDDNTLSVIRKMVPTFDMEVKVYGIKWEGLGTARNLVVDNACGKYIVWLDCDMMFPSDYVKKQVDFMTCNPNAGIAGGKYGASHQKSLVAILENLPFIITHSKYEGKITPKLPGTGGSIYRVEAIKEVGGFDAKIKGAAEDIDAAYRVKNVGWLNYISSATFYEKRIETWKALWSKYFWYGYGMHFVLHKSSQIEKLYEMLPPVAFLEGLLCSSAAYRLTLKKKAFLLPLHFLFKMTAWIFGFMKSHFRSYGHKQLSSSENR